MGRSGKKGGGSPISQLTPLFLKKENSERTFDDVCTLSEICNRHDEFEMDEDTVDHEMPQFRLALLKTQQIKLLQNRMMWKKKLAKMTKIFKRKKQNILNPPLTSSDKKVTDVGCVVSHIAR